MPPSGEDVSGVGTACAEEFLANAAASHAAHPSPLSPSRSVVCSVAARKLPTLFTILNKSCGFEVTFRCAAERCPESVHAEPPWFAFCSCASCVIKHLESEVGSGCSEVDSCKASPGPRVHRVRGEGRFRAGVICLCI
ncbi:hypothetical protein NHX12_008064 [Muraenolepis orangiensis]|uniref:Uncharacterized protein n=1 Tax=Muraenolepis orangiensis TaxID=630683 RepID=A0A9Q0I9F9_9TELE|nr:hypothetical protein NHX12_008064 [Muraenolepis orangiensis]